MQWPRVRSLFDACLALTPADRSYHLHHECGDDHALTEEVERLLRQDALANDEQFMEWPDTGITGIAHSEPVDGRVGTQLGKFRLLHRIAAGGSAVVYRAERMGQTRQEVAIKVLRTWQSDHEAYRRFEAEIQALADLSHPNIARMLDSDIAPDGSPYLVMELVDGGPIDEYCESHAVPLRQRLEWLHTICRAVAFAHGKGILHRDLKPANVLVTNDKRPVVTDFGLAKFIEGPHVLAAKFTTTGAILGTPGYMAPEQVDGRLGRVDFATDIYGLGAVLYTLLVRMPPFRSESIANTLLKVRSEEPLAPRRLDRSIPRDLDTICLRCLEKDPARRYRSVAQLADDVQRFLVGLPVAARPLGIPERSLRWIARNRVVSALFAVIAVSLVTVIGLLVLAEGRRAVAEASRQEARAAVDKMFTESSAWLSRYPHTDELRRRLLSSASDAYERFSLEQSQDPRTLAEAATAAFRLGVIRQQLGEPERARKDVRAALQRFEALAREFPHDLQYQFDVFHCRFFLKEYPEAFQAISDLCQRDPTPDYRDALAAAAVSWGQRKLEAGDLSSARSLLKLGLDTAEGLSVDYPEVLSYRRHVGSSSFGLSTMYLNEDRFVEALKLARRAIQVGREALASSPHNVGYVEDLVTYYIAAAEAAVGLEDFDAARDINQDCESVFAKWKLDHPDSIVASSWLGRWQVWRMQFELLTGDTAAARQAAAVALATLEDGVRRWPSSVELSHSLMLLLANTEFEEFRDVARARKLADSFSDEVHRGRDFGLTAGIVMLRNSRFPEAIQWLKQAQSGNPISSRAYLAMAYLLSGDERAALATMPTDDEWNNSSVSSRTERIQITREFNNVQSKRAK